MSFRFVAGMATGLSFLLTLPSLAQAASMTGSIWMGNPSAGASRAAAVYDQTVPTAGTGMTRTVQFPAGRWNMTGTNMRIFPAFPSVAQNTENFSTTHNTMTFGPGLGAGTVSWCPQFTGCLGFASGTVDQGFVGVTPGPNVFGGVFRMARHLGLGSGAWFVANPGTATPTKTLGFNGNLRGVTVTGTSGGLPTATANTPSSFWSAGISNQETVIDVNPPNKNFTGASLTASGGVANAGNFVGTSTVYDPPDGVATGFKMTTGVVLGSDATPPTTGGGPFSFSSSGYDNRDASGNGNIQMVGGSVAYAGFTGNVFFRTTVVRMAVPEPTMALGLAAGVAGFAGLAGWRRRRSA
ncbi:MAG: hypothetical protein CL908_20920 [Deltaproteobacteria bacterium]|nr:hypothetical protein [Deltaproteobacteria bacterium]